VRDVSSLELADIIDVQAIQAVMDDFHNLTDISVAVIDLQGKVLVSTGGQDICDKFHRIHPETCRNCVESDVELSKGIKPGEFRIYKCKNNMWDMATPIVVGGRHVGSVFLGQFFFEDEVLDYDTFRAQAKRYGFDENEYIAALERVPRWSLETVNRTMTFYVRFANLISMLSYSNVKLAHALEDSKRKKKVLLAERAFSRQLLDTAQTIILLTDTEGKIISFNPYMEQLCGYQLDEVKGKDWFMTFLPVRDHDRMRELYRAIIGGAQTKSNVNPIIARNGNEILVEWYSKVLSDKDNKLVGLLSVGQEITERKQAEEKLRESEMRFRSIFNQTFQFAGIVALDGTLTAANYAATDFIGVNEADVIGKPFWETPWWSHSEELRQWLRQSISRAAKGQTIRREITHTSRHGDLHYFDFSIKPVVDESGKVLYLIPESRDITEHKQAEEKNYAYQQQLKTLIHQLVHTEESSRKYIAGLLHDSLGQSMVFAKLKIDMLIHSESSTTDANVLREISSTLNTLIEQTRSLSFELGCLTLERFGLEAALKEWLVEEVEQKHGIKTRFEQDEQAKPLQEDVRVLLFRVTRELLINVVKHARAKKVAVSVKRVENCIEICVKDDGIGFDVNAKKKSEGFGLLSIYERLAFAGGSIDMQSQPGQGTQITIRAPLDENQLPVKNTKVSSKKKGA
jgi:PAS domain S-box-containing protein